MSQLPLVLFLVAHALIHLGFVSRRPAATAGGPAWPFDLDRSWLLGRAGIDAAVSRPLAIVLLTLVLGGYIVAAVMALGSGPAALFTLGVVVGSVASAAMLILFFHRWLSVGLAIDIVLLWAVLVAGWQPHGLGL
jgi:hypothetical protein